ADRPRGGRTGSAQASARGQVPRRAAAQRARQGAEAATGARLNCGSDVTLDKPLAQSRLLELPGRGTRDLVDELEAIGQLPLGAFGGQVRAQLLRGCVLTLAQDDRRQRPLA